MVILDAKNNGGRIDISSDSFEHLLNCLDNQKFNPCEESQKRIDDFNSQCRKILHSCKVKHTEHLPYWKHFRLNMQVVFRCTILVLFHFFHAILPYNWTSHDYWKI